jgi:hypothetical protein
MSIICNLKGGNAKQRRKLRRLFLKFSPNVWFERHITWHGAHHANGAYHVR